MAKSGKTLKPGEAEPFDFSLATKKHLRVRRKELVLAHSDTLRYEFQRVQGRINWDALRQASTQDEVNAVFSGVDQSSRDRFPNAAAILATVHDPKYPKLRPICFLAESCALALQTNPKSPDQYSPRYSRDICYKERKRRGPAPKPVTNLEYWRGQAESGQRVPIKYLRRINRVQAKEERTAADQGKCTELTYIDIRETIEAVKKRRTTVWLPEATIAKLKKLSSATGAPMAELFRRALEAYFSRS
jgi:predicted DNA binding CopG/RHH family protein